MKYPVIGIAGKARTGKDTAAAMLLEEFGGYRYAFADPIRGMLKAIGVDMSQKLWQDLKEEPIELLGGKSPRYLMQTLGTEWGRLMVDKDIWLKLAGHYLTHTGPGMIISDVRFANEAAWVREQGGLIIHLDRPTAAKVREHESESGVPVEKGDAQILNESTKEHLRKQLIKAVTQE